MALDFLRPELPLLMEAPVARILFMVLVDLAVAPEPVVIMIHAVAAAAVTVAAEAHIQLVLVHHKVAEAALIIMEQIN